MKCPSTAFLFLGPGAAEFGDRLSLWQQAWRSSGDILDPLALGFQLQGLPCSLGDRKDGGEPGRQKKEGYNKDQ